MATTFCEDNAANQANHGGVLTRSKRFDPTWDHLAHVITSWEDAFKSKLISEDSFTKFFDFDKSLVQEIINQPDCVSIRIFPGFDTNGKITACVVGVKNDASDNGTEIFIDDMISVCCCPSNGSSELIR
jgi:hypothetical protein